MKEFEYVFSQKESSFFLPDDILIDKNTLKFSFQMQWKGNIKLRQAFGTKIILCNGCEQWKSTNAGFQQGKMY